MPGPNLQKKCMATPASVVHSSPHETYFLGCPIALSGKDGACEHQGASTFHEGSELAMIVLELSKVNFTTESRCRQFCGYWGEKDSGCSHHQESNSRRKCWNWFHNWGVGIPVPQKPGSQDPCHISHIRPDFARTHEREARGRACHFLEHASKVRTQMGLQAREGNRTVDPGLCQ